MEFSELEGVALDEAVAQAIGVEPGAAYSSDWSHGGPLIERFDVSLSGPGSRVHRNGGPHSGWGESGLWSATSWRMRKRDGRRDVAFHETSALLAAMRLIVACHAETPAIEGDVP